MTEQMSPEPMRSGGVRAGREQIQGEKSAGFTEREMRRRRQSWSGGAEESENERGYEAFDHQPGVTDVWIRDADAQVVKNPEGNTEDPERQTGGKRKSETVPG
jgi:hypothetical protein